MKKISLCALAMVFACATVFANGKNDKVTTNKKAKQECTCPSGKCVKDGKVVDCPKGCTDKDCVPVCVDKKCC